MAEDDFIIGGETVGSVASTDQNWKLSTPLSVDTRATSIDILDSLNSLMESIIMDHTELTQINDLSAVDIMVSGGSEKINLANVLLMHDNIGQLTEVQKAPALDNYRHDIYQFP